MQRVSSIDAFFLYLETPTQPLNICCVLELDTSTMPGGYTYARFRDAFAQRVKAVPEFRMKLADSQLNLDHPVWVDDENFQLRRHLHRVGVPAPGGRRELADIYADIAELPLNRDHPLWEMWVIEGRARGHSLAVMLKAHHAVVDGVGGANLLVQLCGGEPDAPPPPPVRGAGGAYPLQIAASGLLRFALRPWRLATMLPGTASSLVQTLFRVREGRTMAAPFTAPTTAFNASLTGRRNIAYTRLDLGKIKVVKDRMGLTVNDVVFGLCAGVLRRFLLDRDALPDAPLVAASPVSVRDKTDRPGHNQTTWMFCRLETQISDPVDRLRSIAARNAAAKDHSAELGPNLLHNWTQFFNQTMFGTAMRILARIPLTPSPIYNLILSNVPGPQVRLYFLGCEVNGIYPLGPILGGAGLNITVMSLNGQLSVGIISCPDLLPDLWDIADLFPAALEELVQYTDPS